MDEPFLSAAARRDASFECGSKRVPPRPGRDLEGYWPPWILRGLALAIALPVGGCVPPSSTAGPVVKPGGVAELASAEIHPSQVPVAEGGTVQLEAVLRDKHGNVIPVGYENDITWETDSWLTLRAQHGRIAVFEAADDVPYDLSLAVYIKVKNLAQIEPAWVTIVTEALLPVFDRVERAPGSPEGVALLDGRPSSAPFQCRNDKVLILTEVGVFENLSAPCGPQDRGEIALFGPDAMMVFEEAPWSPGVDAIDETSVPGRLEIPVAVWVALAKPQETIDAALITAGEDLAYAHATVFSEYLTGIGFSAVEGGPRQVPWADLNAVGDDCDDAAKIISDNPMDPPDSFELETINVYYVGEIEGSAKARGIRCYSTARRKEPVIYVALNNHSTTTLAHELGHALSLTYPYGGHTTNVAGLQNTNLMWTTNDDGVADARKHLSLGQSFRMNASPDSWLNQAVQLPIAGTPQPIRSADTRVCQCSPHLGQRPPGGWPIWEDQEVGQACPGLAFDVGSQPSPESAFEDHNCGDTVTLTGTKATHDARIMVHARVDREGQCYSGLVGSAYEFPGVIYRAALFPNLRPAAPGCEPFWAAAFFRDGRVLYDEFPAQAGSASRRVTDRIADRLEVDLAPKPNVPVTLHVRFLGDASDPILQQVAKDDFAKASEIFGNDHRSGIELDVVYHTASAASGSSVSSLTPVTAGELNVFYVPDMPTGDPLEAELVADQGSHLRDGASTVRIAIPADPAIHASTGLAHHLGHELGLQHVSAADELDGSNLMWPQQFALTAEPRDRLTLAQVFRIHLDKTSWLAGTSSTALDCQGGDACPPVQAGGQP